MATPKKGKLTKAFEMANKHKWTAAGCGAAWMFGIPLVPGVVELGLFGGLGATKDWKDRKKQEQEKNAQKKLPKKGPDSIFGKGR